MVDKDKVLKEAKLIIDKFHKSLSGVEKLEESRVERDECERQEKELGETSQEFKKIMFKNAPKTSGDCIEAERGKWTN